MSSTSSWKEVDYYFNQKLTSEDPSMKEILETNTKAGLPSIDVSPSQGKMLHILAKIMGAKRILEIGTLGGYSSIWLAKALPVDGQLVTLEAVKKHAQVAEENMKKAGVKHQIDIIIGSALNTLPTLQSKGHEPFDFIFIDADKKNNPQYIKWAINLSRSGTCILVDNVVRNGKVINNHGDEDIQGIRDMVDFLSQNPHIDSTAVQTVGSKGHDGFLLAIVK